MKNLYALLAVGALIFAGCASAPQTQKAVPKTQKPAVTVKKKAPVKIETTVFYPVKEISYYGDGGVDEITLYTYDENGVNLLKKEVFDSDKVLEEMEKYEYSGSMVAVIKRFDKNKELQGYHKLQYNKDKKLTVDAVYNAKDELQSKSEYVWKDGVKVTWKVFDSTGALLNTTNYIYKNGLNVRINNLNSGGDMADYFVIDYNVSRLPVKNTHYNKAGTVLDSRSFSYKDGHLVGSTVLRGNGSVKRKIVYSNDKDGNPVEILYMDAGNNVSERIVREYKSRKVISYVSE